ncbi:MAG TPA: hypothetical protein VNK23_09050 [Candidatus Dormibacteraeota bacterium]|nr:hypothetical protein [Candidatus Dormibacteraeota bacterium]
MNRSKKLFVASLALSLAMAALSPGATAQQDKSSAEFPEGALAPSNLAKPRPKPPFNLTGLWMVDLSAGFSSFMFGPPYPKFKPGAQAAYEEAQQAAKEHKSFRDDIGQCYPAGMPMIMTRVWPIAMIQLPTAIYMISGFENALRIIYIDGRAHTDPDIVVRSFNGDSVGHWEGDTLVVDTTSMVTAHHWIDSGLPLSDEFHIIERMRLINDGKTLEIKYIMTDPKNWEGEWTSTKKWQREDDQDITEVECTPDLNTHLLSTQDELQH